MESKKNISLVMVIVVLLPTMAFGGPQSEFYLNASNQRTITVVQDNDINRSWSTLIPSPSNAFGISVIDTVRTASGGGGVEYTQEGTPTGVVFDGWASEPYIYDGTTDGNYIYSVDFVFGGVYRHDLDWNNPELLFITEEYRLGITYDPSNNSLWLAEWNESEPSSNIENYAMDGTLLRSFEVQVAAVCALAMDFADNTLWFGTQADLHQPIRMFYQYSTDGNLLGTTGYESVSDLNYLGGEFALPKIIPPVPPIPEMCSTGRPSTGYKVGVLTGENIVNQAWNGIDQHCMLVVEETTFTDTILDTLKMLEPVFASDYVICRYYGFARGVADRLIEIQNECLGYCVLDGQMIGEIAAQMYCELSILLGGLAKDVDLIEGFLTLCGAAQVGACESIFASITTNYDDPACTQYTEGDYSEVWAQAQNNQCVYNPVSHADTDTDTDDAL